MKDFLARVLPAIERHPVLAIAILYLALTLPGLGSGYLWDRDETWYASCALNMVQTGDWLTPAAGQKVFVEKPPLAYWMMALSFKAIGITEFAARLPSVLVGLLLLLATWKLAESATDRRTGLMAAAVLATTVHFGVLARMVLVDPALVLGMAVAMASFWRMDSAGDRKTNYAAWCLLGGVGVGVAIMAKGPLGLLPGLLALIYMAARRDFSFLARAKWSLLVGLAAIVVVAVPWHWMVYQANKELFGDEYMVQQNLSRFTNPIQGHEGPFWFYVPVLFVSLVPWVFFLVGAGRNRRAFDRFDLFLAVWAGAPILMFSLMATKLPHYIAPCMPPLAILLAREIEWRLREPEKCPRIADGGLWIMLALGIAICIAGIAAPQFVEDFPVWPILLPGIVCTAGFAFALWARIVRRDLATMCVACAVTMLATFTSVMTFSLERLSPVQVVTVATIEAMKQAGANGRVDDDELFTFAYFDPSLYFYSRGKMQIGKEEKLEEFLGAMKPGASAWILCREKHLDNIQKIIPQLWDQEVSSFDSLKLRDDRLSADFRKQQRFRIRMVKVTKPAVA